jgi:hypothetical protein
MRIALLVAAAGVAVVALLLIRGTNAPAAESAAADRASTTGERALTRSQAIAIVEDRPLGYPPVTRVGAGIYLGLAAAVALVGFGLTIVVKRASRAYVLTDPDDDV